METQHLHPREELVAALLRIYRQRMTTTSGGNLSLIDPEGDLWITPAQVDKGEMQPEDIVQLGGDGRVTSPHPPSSELPFHREIYRRRPDLRAVIHAHPCALVAFSVCHQIPDTRFQPFVHAACGRVALAPYACPGTEGLGGLIAGAFAGGASCVLLENHGVVVGGCDINEAFHRFEMLEFAAQILARAAAVGPVRPLPDMALAGVTSPPFGEAVLPAADEAGPRRELCDFLHRAYRQGLVVSTTGAFSSRLEGDDFLVSPYRRDRWMVGTAEMVRMRGTAAVAGHRPSRASRLHAAIYARHPEVGAVINALPVNAAVFCVTDAPFVTHTIPESYIVLNDVPKLPFMHLVDDAGRIAAEIDPVRRPAVLIANEGVVVVGRTLLEAYDRLEVLESTAEALLLARPLGPLAPMPPAALDELRQAFNLPS